MIEELQSTQHQSHLLLLTNATIADYTTLFENTSKSHILDFKVSFLKEIVSKINLMIEKSFKIGQIVWSDPKRHLTIFCENE